MLTARLLRLGGDDGDGDGDEDDDGDGNRYGGGYDDGDGDGDDIPFKTVDDGALSNIGISNDTNTNGCLHIKVSRVVLEKL